MVEAEVDVMVAGEGLRVYPEAAEVFVADQPELARHLHPLVSIDLARVDPAWHGWIHLVSPLEPAEGYLGDHTPAFHGALQRANWLGFAMDGDQGDRYRLLGDLRYFVRATTPEELPEPWPGFREELAAHCERQERSYRAHREVFRREGRLLMLDEDDVPYSHDAVALLEQLGGGAEPGNWADFELFRLEEDGEFVRPVSAAGHPFRFVAAVPGWHYRRSGADWILLFFEPVERLALLTFDWS
ncbi:hypothetical protein GCM10009665_54800 [Kitasatospora nipponensis]|uniref:Uncharacterized protein n=1 Tax=Kitasatospora nipponensis TaxID=258049 RepID=A0ABN1WNZ6_9ACTN